MPQPDQEVWCELLQPMAEAPIEARTAFGPCLLLARRDNGELYFIVGIWSGSVWCDMDWERLAPIRWLLLPPVEAFREIPAAPP